MFRTVRGAILENTATKAAHFFVTSQTIKMLQKPHILIFFRDEVLDFVTAG